MQITKNGIPIDIPGLRKKVDKVRTTKNLHNDFNKFKKFATMIGYEDGCRVTAIVPMAHQDFKTLKDQGYRVIEVWEKGEIA